MHGRLRTKRKRLLPEKCFCGMAVSNWRSLSLQISLVCSCIFQGVDPGVGGLDPWNYVVWVRVCFITFFHLKLLLDNFCKFHIIKDERILSKVEGKTNFSRCLKQFDGLTWLTLTAVFYDRSTSLAYSDLCRCVIWSIAGEWLWFESSSAVSLRRLPSVRLFGVQRHSRSDVLSRRHRIHSGAADFLPGNGSSADKTDAAARLRRRADEVPIADTRSRGVVGGCREREV